MNRLAIFVEGQTELLFVEKLLREIASANQLTVELFGATGGTNAPFRMTVLRRHASNAARHYVQIVDCQSDGNVKPYIQERYQGLARANYWAVVGIRDVFPLLFSQIASLRVNLASGIKTNPVNVEFVLGIMEVEAWFIGEHTHFLRLSPELNNVKIVAKVGFDPETADIQMRPNPAVDLHSIYQIAGLAYRKKQAHCLRTIESLDCAQIYCELGKRFPDLQRLIQTIDTFLALP